MRNINEGKKVSMNEISKQRIYQLKKKALGLCVQCGKVAVTKNHCVECRGKANRRRMEYYFRKVRNQIDKAVSDAKEL